MVEANVTFAEHFQSTSQTNMCCCSHTLATAKHPVTTEITNDSSKNRLLEIFCQIKNSCSQKFWTPCHEREAMINSDVTNSQST